MFIQEKKVLSIDINIESLNHLNVLQQSVVVAIIIIIIITTITTSTTTTQTNNWQIIRYNIQHPCNNVEVSPGGPEKLLECTGSRIQRCNYNTHILYCIVLYMIYT